MEAGKYRAFQVRLNLRSEPRTKLVAKTPNPQILARVSLLASHERLREKRLCLAGVQAIKSRFFAPIYRKYLYILSYPVFLYYAESPKVPPRGQILPANSSLIQRDQINSLRNGRDSDLKQNENAFKDPEDGFGRKTVQGIDTLAGNSEVY